MAQSKYKRRKEMSIPQRFVPRFWDEADGRSTIVRVIRERFDRLMQDTGADSYQKELLVQEAIFVAIQLETLRVKAAESGELDAGSYTQLVNCLQGLLNKLGLDRRMHEVVTLQDVLNGSKR
ncbi:MAG: hypothetical protein RIC55_36250 [Pirellulaceae bacterium]